MAARGKEKHWDNFYREAPFWSWNDVLEPKEAVEQIKQMEKGGWGGFFMHARVGLETEYMGKDWMKVVKACVAYAKKKGLCAYLYDENKWPSGFAGGAVPKKGAKYRAKYLVLSENLVEKTAGCKWVASFLVDRDGSVAATPEATAADVQGEGAIYNLYQYTTGLGNQWFLGTSYVDLLDADTTAEFIKVTHEKYKAAVGGEFGKTIPAIFTDEPALAFIVHGHAPAVPWTTSLPRVFRERRGYDVRKELLSLFLPVGDWRKVRYDFYRTVTEMFVENYTKQLYEWSEENSLPLTGHMMAEDTIASQVLWSGAAMPHYEYMHMPGMDHLGKNIEDPATAKQVSSVADQLGKERVLSELYGCSGQDFNLKGRKWIADWHLALGVNLLNPHLWLYTMRGARKRDFPPTISFQQPHWGKSAALSAHNAGVSKLLTRGKRVVDVLVVHPVESGWCAATPLEAEALEELDKTHAAVVDELLAGHLDFHFGDESLMAKYGSVKGGKLSVGKGRYGVAVLPGNMTLRATTLELLREFVEAGGKVIVVGKRPTLVDGAKGQGAIIRKALGGAAVVPVGKLAGHVRKVSDPPVVITGTNAGKVLYHLRDQGARRVLFLANTDYDKRAKVTVTVGGGKRFTGRLKFSTGMITALAAKAAKGKVAFDLELAETESAVVVLAGKAFPAAKRARGRAKTVKLARRWKVAETSENSLTIDHVRIPQPSVGWSSPQYVLFAAEELKAAGGRAKARYEFEVEKAPVGKVYVAMERAREWEVTFNGSPVAALPGKYFIDKSFERIEVTGLVRERRNTVEVEREVGKDFELESIYVVGRFGVREREGGYVLGTPPEEVTIGDVTGQGLSFFAGVLQLEQEVELGSKPQSAVIELEGLYAGAADVAVNGVLQGDFNYPPYRVETGNLRKGKNVVRIRLFSALRNLLGPHHFEGEESGWVSPGTFVDRKRWSDEYRLVRFGASGVKLKVRQ